MNLHEQVISLHLFRSLNSFNNILQFQCSGLIQFSLDLFLGTGWFLLLLKILFFYTGFF